MENSGTKTDRAASVCRSRTAGGVALAAVVCCLTLVGCKGKEGDKTAEEAPPAPSAVIEGNGQDVIRVQRAERFPLVQTVSRSVLGTVDVTGTVNPDVSREIPVLSLATGRVTALHVQLGDTVSKGQLVMEVQSPDVATAFNTYLKAVNDEHLAKVTLDRDVLLYAKGAIPQSQLQAAQGTEDDAKADLTAAEQQLRILGVDRAHPGDSVKVYAPASGVVIAQNVTAAGAAGITYAGNTGSFTIADLSHVWVICDVYENNLASVKLGQHADIRVTAFPGQTFSGTISDIGAQLDPSLRTAKVRIQVENPRRMLRLGMFVTATLKQSEEHETTAVSSGAVLQLHDRAYVFVPGNGAGLFRRVEVKLGKTLDGGLVEIVSGIGPGQQVAGNALDLQNTADQE